MIYPDQKAHKQKTCFTFVRRTLFLWKQGKSCHQARRSSWVASCASCCWLVSWGCRCSAHCAAERQKSVRRERYANMRAMTKYEVVPMLNLRQQLWQCTHLFLCTTCQNMDLLLFYYFVQQWSITDKAKIYKMMFNKTNIKRVWRLLYLNLLIQVKCTWKVRQLEQNLTFRLFTLIHTYSWFLKIIYSVKKKAARIIKKKIV